MQFPATLALQDVSIDIFEGEILGLVGENGAGKSTLLKIIMGVQKPTKGEMFVNGVNYAPKSPMEANLMGIGMVFQEQSLITNLTVGQNLFFIYNKAPYDPERTMSASRSSQGLDNFSTPSTRTLGFNVKVNF